MKWQLFGATSILVELNFLVENEMYLSILDTLRLELPSFFTNNNIIILIYFLAVDVD